jgi:nucleoside-diphosphate-sugar epimerase
VRVLVSGGTGLVGRYIVEGLLSAGYSVVVGGRTPPAEKLFSAPVRFVRLDLDPALDQTYAFDGVQAFVHAAFDHLPGRYRGGEGNDPGRFRRLNLEGSIRLFETARAAGLGHAVLLSSRAVYDGVQLGTTLTEDLQLSPTSLYGEIKLACEQTLAGFSTPGFVTASLRATGVYGEFRPNKWDGLIADALDGKPLAPRAGTEVHGEDVARAVRLMIETDAAAINGECFNLSDITIDTRTIVERLGIAAQVVALPALSANIMNTEKIRRIGWKPGGMRRFEKTMLSLARPLGKAH